MNIIVRHVAFKSMCSFVMISLKISAPNVSNILGIYSNALIILARSYRVWNKNEKKTCAVIECEWDLFCRTLFRLAGGQNIAEPHKRASSNAMRCLQNLSIVFGNCSRSESGWMRFRNLIAQPKDLLPRTYYGMWWRGADRIAHVKKMSDSTLILISEFNGNKVWAQSLMHK